VKFETQVSKTINTTRKKNQLKFDEWWTWDLRNIILLKKKKKVKIAAA
jgi:hypothetical protein